MNVYLGGTKMGGTKRRWYEKTGYPQNAMSFDAKDLYKALRSCCKLGEFCKIALGFSDTLPVFE